MQLNIPLEPKDPNGPLRVIVIGRISTPHQPMTNIDASNAYVEQFLRKNYEGEIHFKFLGERASGMLVDRATMMEAEAEIETGTWDLTIGEDLSRIYRNPQFQFAFVNMCVDNETRLICIGDNLDTADDNWEVALQTASLRHGLTIPDTRRRVKRTASNSFDNGGMVQKVRFSYRKLTKDEAASGNFGPVGLRITRLVEWTPTIMEIRARFLAGWEYEDLAAWLNVLGIPTGPYVEDGRWTAKLVKDLLDDDILWGLRTFQRVIFQPVRCTGKFKRKKNKTPSTKYWACLAHMTKEEYAPIRNEIHRREAEHSRAGESKRRNVRRSDSFFPAQLARCIVCGEIDYQYDGDQLKCQNAHRNSEHRCWNHVQVDCGQARVRFVEWLDGYLYQFPRGRKLVLDTAWKVFEEAVYTSRRANDGLFRQIQELEAECRNLTKAIRKGKRIARLARELDAAEERLEELREAQSCKADTGNDSVTSITRDQLDGRLRDVLLWLAANSYDFARLLRRLISEFWIVPVQALDSGLVRARARLVVDFGRFAEMNGVPVEGHLAENRVELEFDLFEPPLHVRHLPACIAARRENSALSLKGLAAEVSHRSGELVGRMTVRRALAYAKLMAEEGLSSPYRELGERPQNASRWKPRKPRTAIPTDSAVGPATGSTSAGHITGAA